jgi:predicted ATPase
MIKRIKIEGYKSFKSIDLELSPVSVIFGPNASGKSNLLDAFYLISRMATCRTLAEAFEGHRGLPLESFYYDNESPERLRRQEKVHMSFQVDVEISEEVIARVNKLARDKRKGTNPTGPRRELVQEHHLRYDISIEALRETGHIRVVNERVAALTKNGTESKGRKPFLERMDHHGSARLHLRMEGQAHPFYHELHLDHTIVSTPLYEPYYPHITALREEFAQWQTYYLEPRALMREAVPVAEISQIGPRGDNLAAFLNILKHEDQKAFENFNLTLSQALPFKAAVEIEQLDTGQLMLKLSENNVWYSARLISEGTLRLMGLIAAVSPETPATVVCYEEPENGVHPVRIKIVADLLRNAAKFYGKQIIVTTHSPIFANNFQYNELFVSRKKDNQSTIEPCDSGELFKKNQIERALEDRIARGDYGG